MFMQEYNIAKSEHQARNARLNSRQETEGVTVARPGLFERAWAALRGLRTRYEDPAPRPALRLTRGAPAR